ncbi:MAG: hypothetical protein ABI193_09395, partial [Minicystis sp.]
MSRNYWSPLFACSLYASLALTALSGCHNDGSSGDDGKHDPVAGHPRLLVTEADLPRLRSWAVAGNPTYDGLRTITEAYEPMLDAVLTTPKCTDPQGGRFCETMAEHFAFLSLLATNAADRDVYAQKARSVLMRVIELASSPTPGDTNSVS